MGGFGSIVRGALAGLNNYTGDQRTAAALEQRNLEERQKKQSEMQMRIMPHAIAIRGIQQQLQALDPKAPDYNERHGILTNDIARNLHAVREIIHPDEQPQGNFFERGITDKLHLTSFQHRLKKDQEKGEKGAKEDIESAKGIAEGQVPFLNSPEAQKIRLQAELRTANEKPNYKNIRLASGQIVPMDVNHQAIPSGAVIVGNMSTTMRSMGGGIGVRDAARTGSYKKPDGTMYTKEELNALPANMKLSPISMNGELVYLPSDQTTSRFVFNNMVYEKDQYGNIDLNNPLGYARVGSTSIDAFGVAQTTQPMGGGGWTPQQPFSTPPEGAPTGTPAPAAPTGAPAAAPAAHPQASAPHAAGRGAVTPHHAQLNATRAAQLPKAEGSIQVDEQGHLPASAGNPYLVQAANSILDGMDVDKLPLPLKDKTAAMNMAKNAVGPDGKKVWKGQGLFTPREVLQLKEGATVIDNLMKSDALDALDDQGFFGNFPMWGQSSDPSKAGITDRVLTKVASGLATPQQQEFLRYWRQLDAVAIGLRGLVQTQRATQTQVERLIAELPNPYNTTSAADARERLKLVQNELRVAAETGKLPDVPLGQSGGGDSGVIVVKPEDMPQ